MKKLIGIVLIVLAIFISPPLQAQSYGTYYLQSFPAAPYPFDPYFGMEPITVLDASNHIYLVQDSAEDYAAMQSFSSSMNLMSMDVPMPGEGDGGTNELNFNLISPDYGTNLWLEITGISGGTANLLLSNTVADVQYEILGVSDLADTNWLSEGFCFGSEITNWTATSVSIFDYTNHFYWARSWEDSDGNGIADWWELQNFGMIGIDAYGDADGDGWNNLQEFQNGTNPNLFNTPPTPLGISVLYHVNNGTASISWPPSPSPVTSYTVKDSEGNTYNFSSSTLDFDLSVPNVPNRQPEYGDPTVSKSFQVQAHYSGGSSGWSGSAAVEPETLSAFLVPGSSNKIYLAVSGIPANAVTLWAKLADWILDQGGDTSHDVTFVASVSILTNGIGSLPAEWFPASYEQMLWLQTSNADGSMSAAAAVQDYWLDRDENFTSFYDGRIQLKQDLKFLLRVPNPSAPNSYGSSSFSCWIYTNGSYLKTITTTTNYVYSHYYDASGVVDGYQPFDDNYFYRNFVFSMADVITNGTLTNIVFDGPSSKLILTEPVKYQFIPSLLNNQTTIPGLLSDTDARWMVVYPYTGISFGSFLSAGSIQNNQLPWTMAVGASNYFGLPYLSTEFSYRFNNTLSSGNLSAGNTIWLPIVIPNFYFETAQPQFQTVEYDFWNPNNSYTDDYPPFTRHQLDFLPGWDGFSPTNASDKLIFSTPSDPFVRIAGYAKLAMQNGRPNLYSYLGQYFDAAYKVDENGNVTTNRTGLLSPYGGFFPTEGGAAALATMSDPDTGQRGTSTVYCVSLNVDKNHDGQMDLSFSGSDATSPQSPFIFWVNNDFDRGHTVDFNDVEMDDLQFADCPRTPNVPTPDCNYRDIGGNRVIPSTRDLEDFARLWVCGITPNLVSNLPANSIVRLSYEDVGNPDSNNPTVDIFQAIEGDGGIGYLTNETVAMEQIDPALNLYLGRIAPGQSIDLPPYLFEGQYGRNHLLWCGVARGKGNLYLQILDSTGRQLCWTSVSLEIKDIKEMYERWTVGDDPYKGPTNNAYLAAEGSPVGASAFQYAPPMDTNTPYILFVHGWNMPTWEKDRFAETTFKRLYWQGYQGKFGSFRWPTYFDFPFGELSAQALQPRNFDNSESNAWASAIGLLNRLTDLNTQYPNRVYLAAHSMGNVIAGEALRLATNQVVNTYVALQAAVASHAYDPNAPIRDLTSFNINWDSGTPNCYSNYPAGGGSCYFNNPVGAGTYVNFYNTNDWALRLLWTIDQDVKPDNGLFSFPGYHYSLSLGFYKIIGPNTHVLNFPTNTYEIFSFCDEARCQAVGRQKDVGGIFKVNGVYQQIELDDLPYGFGSAHKYHSGEFRSDNAQRWQFWYQTLHQMGLK